ncbi:MAG TPA: ImmA/IrrE family metallo-endopeptidase [Deltaproteobacteria bacterium]|nr:ImmA/IrrE family metallo-endopeptidase [Deltaproteobacteria bacterium]
MSANFGERLKGARKMSGLSMEALSERVGQAVTKQAISKYEMGLMNPGSDALVALSRALGVKSDYFFRSQKVSLGELEFRKKSKLGRKEEESVRYRTLDFLERYREIEDILGDKAIFKNPLSDINVLNPEDAEKAAFEIRRKWKLGEAPISNLMELLEDKVIRIFEIETGEAFHGISAWAGDIPVIAVRKQDDLLRKQFTISHELGHILLKIREKNDQRAREKLCHTFAGAFLLPENVIKAELGEQRTKIALWELKKIKGIYGISIQAIMARARHLGIISDYTYRNFCITVNTRGWKTEEPGEYLGKEHANRFDQLVYRAAAEEIITFSRAAELLNLPLSEFRRAFQLVS